MSGTASPELQILEGDKKKDCDVAVCMLKYRTKSLAV